jgi:hypothetical protein
VDQQRSPKPSSHPPECGESIGAAGQASGVANCSPEKPPEETAAANFAARLETAKHPQQITPGHADRFAIQESF